MPTYDVKCFVQVALASAMSFRSPRMVGKDQGAGQGRFVPLDNEK